MSWHEDATPEIPTLVSGIASGCGGRRGMAAGCRSRDGVYQRRNGGRPERGGPNCGAFTSDPRGESNMSVADQLIEKNCKLSELLRLATKKA